MNNGNLIKNFLEMVKIDSISGEENEFADFCIAKLKKLGFSVKKDRYGNIVARNKNQSKNKPLILSAHLDTVQPGNDIKPIIRRGFVFSDNRTILGADNKLAIAVYFTAIQDLINEKEPIPPLEIILTREEELGMKGIKNFDFSLVSGKEGVSLDSEGDVGCFISQSPFAEIFELKIIGRPAHAAFPEKGIDALKIFSKAYAKLKTGRIDENTTLNFGVISGGVGGNIVMGELNCSGNIRSHKLQELTLLKEKMQTVFEKEAENQKGKARISFLKVMSGYNHQSSGLFIKKIMKAAGQDLLPKKTNGGSDANIFMERGIKIIDLCHGAKNTHTIKENISLKSAASLLNLVKKIINNYE